jgi:hypothetical protein
MQGSQPVRFLVILSTVEGGDVAAGAVTLGRIAPAYYLFKDAGAEVVLATLMGGYPRLADFKDVGPQAKSRRRFLLDTAARDDLADTLAADQIVPEDFDAALFLGFSGALWEDRYNPMAAILTSLLENGKPVAMIPGNALVTTRRSVGDGLLIFGDSDDAPNMAAHALRAIVMERRHRIV